MDKPDSMLCVIPSRLAVGEPFAVKVKLLGPVHPIPSTSWNWSPHESVSGSPFNLNVARKIQFMDNCLPEWCGELQVEGQGLEGPARIEFDGKNQGVFTGDVRPIRVVPGFRWSRPGFHFVRLIDPVSGTEALSNPVCVTEDRPRQRLYWGDPHWQSFFSDGIRIPEQLYAFARDEGFLDFGALSDHMEAVTDRQWEYYQAVTNDFNQPGVFVTLHGQEWTHHIAANGAPGHRNIYYRGNGGPVLRSNDSNCNTLDKLWRKLDAMQGIESIAIPHHPANVVMGVKWELGWNPKYEKAVEIHSVWGSSERHAEEGNPLPIRHCKGEMRGRHVIDALKRGYRLGFVGGGDIHDGRPGDDLHSESYPPEHDSFQPEGFTAAWVPELTRENIFDAMTSRRTYATTKTRLYLEAILEKGTGSASMQLRAASEEGLRDAVLVRNGEDAATVTPQSDPRVIEASLPCDALAPDEFAYVRVTTKKGVGGVGVGGVSP